MSKTIRQICCLILQAFIYLAQLQFNNILYVLFMQRHYICVEQHTNGCIVNAKTSAFIDECALLIVDQMASGAQLRAGMCQSPSWHDYWPAALFCLSCDWLRVTV